MSAGGDDGRDAVQRELDQQLWDMRLAAVLNTLDVAKSHGEHRDWTSEHARQIRAMMAIADATVLGDGAGVVPQGFGPAVHTQLALKFIQASARAEARNQKPEDGSRTSVGAEPAEPDDSQGAQP